MNNSRLQWNRDRHEKEVMVVIGVPIWKNSARFAILKMMISKRASVFIKPSLTTAAAAPPPAYGSTDKPIFSNSVSQ